LERVKRSDTNFSFDFYQRLQLFTPSAYFRVGRIVGRFVRRSIWLACHSKLVLPLWKSVKDWRNACISNTALPPNTLAPTTSRDRTRSQSISLLATSHLCAPAFFVRRSRHRLSRRAAKFARKLTHDSPTRAPYPIGAGVRLNRVRFAPDPGVPYGRHRATFKVAITRTDLRDRIQPTASVCDRTWNSFQFTVLTEVVAQPVFRVSALLRGHATIPNCYFRRSRCPPKAKVIRSKRVEPCQPSRIADNSRRAAA
jgi:hypothetical protein